MAQEDKERVAIVGLSEGPVVRRAIANINSIRRLITVKKGVRSLLEIDPLTCCDSLVIACV